MAENFSYSKLDLFKQCGFKYKLKYVDKHFLYDENISTALGHAIHSIEEDIANTFIKDANATIDYIALKNKFIIEAMKVRHKFPQDYVTPDKSGQTCEEKVKGYLDNGIYRLERQLRFNPGYKIIAAELPFEFDFYGAHFKGKIDRVIYDSVRNRYLIQDIKTYSVPVDRKDLTPIPLQFVVYVLAVEKLYNITAGQIHCQYDLPFCDCIQDTCLLCVGPSDLSAIEQLLDSIKQSLFIPNPGPLCHWCEFCPTNPGQPEGGKNLCPYYSLWTRENKTKAVAEQWQGLDRHAEVMANYLKKQQELIENVE